MPKRSATTPLLFAVQPEDAAQSDLNCHSAAALEIAGGLQNERPWQSAFFTLAAAALLPAVAIYALFQHFSSRRD